MAYRDDLEAAHARIRSLEEELHRERDARAGNDGIFIRLDKASFDPLPMPVIVGACTPLAIVVALVCVLITSRPPSRPLPHKVVVNVVDGAGRVIVSRNALISATATFDSSDVLHPSYSFTIESADGGQP